MRRKLTIIALLAIFLSGCNTDIQTANDCVYEQEKIGGVLESTEGGGEHMENKEVSNRDREIYLKIAKDVGFDWDNTVHVLNEAIGRTEADAMIIAEVLGSAGVRGALKAELPESEPGQSQLLEVESEDNKLYILSISLPVSSNRVASVHNIKDVETDELIYAKIR